MDNIIKGFFETIKENDIEKLKKDFSGIDWSSVDIYYIDSIFCEFLHEVYRNIKSNGNYKCDILRVLISLFSQINPTEDYLPLFSSLFMERKYPDELLSLIIDQYHEITSIEHIVVILHF